MRVVSEGVKNRDGEKLACGSGGEKNVLRRQFMWRMCTDIVVLAGSIGKVRRAARGMGKTCETGYGRGRELGW